MPHAQILSALEGHPGGRILVTTLGDDPAAGSEISITVPGRAMWEVLTLRFFLATDATVVNRFVSLVIGDGNRELFHIPQAGSQSASLTSPYIYLPNADRVDWGEGGIMMPWPPGLLFPPGWTITTRTSGLQAGDNFAAPLLYIREIPERGEGVWDELARAVATEIIERRALNV